MQISQLQTQGGANVSGIGNTGFDSMISSKKQSVVHGPGHILAAGKEKTIASMRKTNIKFPYGYQRGKGTS